MNHRRLRVPIFAAACALAATACGSHSATALGTPTVSDATAKHLLVRALDAAYALGHDHHLCQGCYPSSAADITEDMNTKTGDPYAIAFTPTGVTLPGVVYLDTVGNDKLTHTHITFYARTPAGAIWQLDANTEAPRIFRVD